MLAAGTSEFDEALNLSHGEGRKSRVKFLDGFPKIEAANNRLGHNSRSAHTGRPDTLPGTHSMSSHCVQSMSERVSSVAIAFLLPDYTEAGWANSSWIFSADLQAGLFRRHRNRTCADIAIVGQQPVAVIRKQYAAVIVRAEHVHPAAAVDQDEGQMAAPFSPGY